MFSEGPQGTDFELFVSFCNVTSQSRCQNEKKTKSIFYAEFPDSRERAVLGTAWPIRGCDRITTAVNVQRENGVL